MLRPYYKPGNKSDRSLYKIGYVTKLLGITSRTLRYYDQAGILPHVKRSDGGIRLFDDEDIAIIKEVRRLQSENGLSLEEIKEKLYGKKTAGNSDICVLTDSTATLPIAVDGSEKLPIEIIPLKIILGDKTYHDGVDISLKEIWEKSKEQNVRPTTSPPTEEDFLSKYTALAKKGYKTVYSIHISSTLSKTVEVARSAAAKMTELDVQVIDSKSTGAGLGLFCMQVGEQIVAGSTKKEISLYIAKQVPMIYMMVMVDSLRHLVTGGKLSAPVSTQVASEANLLLKLFSFKPVFEMKNGTGSIDIIECSKDKRRATELMVESLNDEVSRRGGYINRIMVLYNYLYGEATEAINKIKNDYPNVPIFLQEDTGLLSIYVGPETIAISIA
jgi:DegV family protein with EDD domain